MPIKFRCPHCKQFLGISRKKAGMLSDCPTCGRTLRVPNLDGTVDALPSPKLNLDDSGLRQALGALASLDESSAKSYEQLEIEQPQEVFNKKGQDISGEMPIVIAKPVEKPPVHELFAATDGVEVSNIDLDQLASLDAFTPIIEDDRERIDSRLAIAVVVGCAVISLVFGFFLGRMTAPLVESGKIINAFPASVEPAEEPVEEAVQLEQAAGVEKPETSVFGTISYVSMSGDTRPDRGARVLILPMKRSGMAKLSGAGIRVGADEVDQEVLRGSARALGGAFTLAGESGKFSVAVLPPGKYGLLIASRFQASDESQSINTETESFLEQYFEQPTTMIGRVRYAFQVIEVTETQPAEFQHIFSVN